MTEKKLVSRKTAIVLGIVCIILAVGLVGAIANYTSIINGKDNTIATKNSEIADKNSTITSLNSQIETLTSQKNQIQTWLDGNKTLLSQTQTWLQGNITYYNSQITNLQNQISSLNAHISNLTDIVNLAKSTIWVSSATVSQPASSFTFWTVSASYAGYVSVDVLSSTTILTYVEVIYSSHGVSYDQEIHLNATSGTAVFPVLPATITIRVGNTNIIGATETVTITYYY